MKKLLLLCLLLSALPAHAQRASAYKAISYNEIFHCEYDGAPATVDGKIEGCLASAALAANSGICDCTDLNGTQTFAGTITIDESNVTLLLGAITLSSTDNGTVLAITGDDVIVQGLGDPSHIDMSADVASAAEHHVEVTGDRVTLRSFMVTGNRDQTTETGGVYFTAANTGGTIERLHIVDAGNNGIQVTGATNMVIRDNHIVRSDDSGINVASAASSDHVWIERNWCEDCCIAGLNGTSGIMIDAGSSIPHSNIWIRDNFIDNSDRNGITHQGHGASGTVNENVTITGNTVHTTGATSGNGEGITGSSNGCIISNNRVHLTAVAGILIFGKGSHCTISNNVISDTSSEDSFTSHPAVQLRALSTANGGVGDGVIDEITITGNLAYNSPSGTCGDATEPCVGSTVQLQEDTGGTLTDIVVNGNIGTTTNSLRGVTVSGTDPGASSYGNTTGSAVTEGMTIGKDVDEDITILFATDSQDRGIVWDQSAGCFEIDFDGTVGDGEDPTICTASITTPPTATPTTEWTDSDAVAEPEDPSANIAVNLTDTGDGTEDADVTISQQIAGGMTAALVLDADGVGAFALNVGASPPATCTAGAVFIDTDETVDTNCTTTSDNQLCICIATDTWAAFISD